MRYARNLVLVSHEGYLEAVMLNPWDSTRILHRYLLGKSDSLPPQTGDATPIVTPLQRAAVFTSVHCALLQELGCVSAIGGVCELEYIHLSSVREGVREGRIADLGNGMQPNIERIIQLKPDALMPTPFEHSGGYGRIERMGIPIVECADYMECSPLARAEWIRFYGRLFDRGAKADSLFLAIERDYLALAARAAETASRPRMICEIPQSGYWFMPAGESTMGQLYAHAGARYLFDDLPGAGSVSLGIERVLERGVTADVWLVKLNGPLRRAQLVADYPALRRIPARIWCCDLSTSQFYEETPFHPELLLEDILSVLHPELGIVPRREYYHEVTE
ncbi:MAG: ABC transporter substrate-binding protein [Bacteroidaceae bacterium]|nr:ABC transporter substrate-binding protein [Bacteroidaceae bacterium]